MKIIDKKIPMGDSNSQTAKNILRRAIRIALTGSVMASGIAAAALQDHGPSDAALGWPQWYRDLDGLPLGLCKSQAPSPDPNAGGAPMCFPIAVDPAGFPGNIGDEIFYMNLNANIANGGIDLRYIAALEAAYGNAAGTPIKGQEVVFARIRFVMHVLNDQCAGTYRIIHPYGDQIFNDVPAGRRALFETIDIPLGALLDFEGALNGPLGPFLQWDGDGDQVPLPRTPGGPLNVGGTEFIGDPSVLHTYTGSPFIETNLDGTPKYFLAGGITPQHQNYLKVIAPEGCDIGGVPVANGGEGINVQKESMGFLMGQVWTAPIATPTKVTQAEFTRTAAATTVDVWAKSAKDQTLYLTSSGFSGVRMTPELDEFGVQTGKYQAHLELPGSAVLPSVVEVVNATSNPVVRATTALSDIVNISSARYDPLNNLLCVSAQSSDRAPPDGHAPQLTLLGEPLTDTQKPDCPVVKGGDLTLVKAFPQGVPGPLNRAPESVKVTSSLFGASTEQVAVLTGAPDNSDILSATADSFLNPKVSGTGSTTLDVGFNDATQGEIFIVDQPSAIVINPDTNQPETVIVGAATGSLNGGTATFTPNPGTAGLATFSYLVKTPSGVSNLVNVEMDVEFVAAAPTGNPDSFAVLRTNNAAGFTAQVLKNDTAAAGTTINPASVTVTQQGTRGVATANGDGSITYRPNGATTGTDVFFYTVSNTAGTASAPVRVDVVVENSGESIGITRNKINNGRWDLRMTTTWFGAPLTSTGSCWLVRVNNANVTPRLIGIASVDATGAVQMQPLGTKLYNAANYDPAVDVPLLPSKVNYTIRCGTSNAVVPLPGISNPVQSADNTTTSP